ncbi:MAG TPA: DNA polymerase III subunit alpha [Pirellulaceae bacterium]|nr:DNA polymerase III subunit alpha [Pirellulaceae bacterium]
MDSSTQKERPFVHLHCHTHYSLLDGASRIDELLDTTAALGMNALAITDHGNLHGALEFYRQARRRGINPIIGYEAYITSGSRHNKNLGDREQTYHLTLLCQNQVGFRNLIKLASAASLEGFYFKPRIDRELLSRYAGGLICLSGCVSSEFNQRILAGDPSRSDAFLADAEAIAAWFHQLFGNRYFIEIMNNGVEVQQLALQGAVAVANRMGLPLVATSDCHYVKQTDAAVQDVMLCINTGHFRTDTNRMKMDGDQYYLRAPDEMYRLFPGLEEAVRRSQEIANSVDIQLSLNARHFPVYQLPEEVSPDVRLRELCEQGLRERYARIPEMWNGEQLADPVRSRLDRELKVINQLGFANYFLICWDFVQFARSQHIAATARGSGVGALVCYALYLSHVCPIKYGLLFERFLDENRLEAPDIDIDFCQERRGEVIRYVKMKYGEENVAQIGTFNTMAARAAIKDVGRVLGIPLARVNQLTALVPTRPGVTLQEALDEVEELRRARDTDPDVREIIEFAIRLEGLARNIGTHAAAVVIGDQPLTEYVPLCRVAGKDDVITQWSMADVEAAGLLKMDFLGLRNLTILSNAIVIIEQTRGEKLDPLEFPLDDPDTFRLLQAGETKGIFQLESGGIRDLLIKMKPDHFRDIIATNALYRPGPLEGGLVDQYVAVKNGRRKAHYLHPVLKDILEDTHGVMVYQEQVMQILNRLGQIPLASAYTCIKAISKKKEQIIEENHEQFLTGALSQGLKKGQAEELWQMILKFAGYGFNKSHSTAYALIAYQTAYLKAHYPLEFMAALLTGDLANRNFSRKDSLVEHLEDCQRMGLTVLPPNINQSRVNFSVSEGNITFALGAIKGCGGAAGEAIVRNREANGPFTNLFDFCERIEPSHCSRAAIEALIKSGAMDVFGNHRAQLIAALDSAMQAASAAQADRRRGQMSLFVDDDQTEMSHHLPPASPWDKKQQLAHEKEVLGLYLSSHPLESHLEKLRKFCQQNTANLASVPDRQPITLGGIISSIKHAHVKRTRDEGGPTKYANFDLEDLTGAIRCIQWPTEFATQGHLIQPDAVVVVQGVLDRRGGDEPNLIANRIIPIDQLDADLTKGLAVRICEWKHGEQTLRDVREIVRGYPGSRRLVIELALNDGSFVKLESQRLRLDIRPELCERLERTLGPQSLEFLIHD